MSIKKIFTTAAMAVCTAAAFVWNGYAITVLWSWFVVPSFALPPVSLTTVIGISLVYWLISAKTFLADIDPSDDEIWESIVIYAIRPLGALLCGYIITMSF